ncbi:hypothetical protein C8R44DRAFT_817923 [Mycena epipterygia]|nr:hypothetical protein C8R44DRAFT_817923 [Mycena epipterygia]
MHGTSENEANDAGDSDGDYQPGLDDVDDEAGDDMPGLAAASDSESEVDDDSEAEAIKQLLKSRAASKKKQAAKVRFRAHFGCRLGTQLMFPCRPTLRRRSSANPLARVEKSRRKRASPPSAGSRKAGRRQSASSPRTTRPARAPPAWPIAVVVRPVCPVRPWHLGPLLQVPRRAALPRMRWGSLITMKAQPACKQRADRRRPVG